MRSDFERDIFNIHSESDFRELAIELFRYQAESNTVYKTFLKESGIIPRDIKSLNDIPFLPVSLFKRQKVVSGDFEPEIIFKSSGTTEGERSVHMLKSIALYERSFTEGFGYFFGDPSLTEIYALLPSYLETGDSSLVFMADRLIALNRDKKGGFFLYEHENLISQLRSSLSSGKKVMLLGVTFALLDLASSCSTDLKGLILVETGGMKGRRKEIVREEVHAVLKAAFNIDTVCSEYGMTELLSQAWSQGEGVFRTPPWMKILIRDAAIPGQIIGAGLNGGINIIDLANIHSCSFIETADMGISYDDASFEVRGRFDSSDIRGCNLLV